MQSKMGNIILDRISRNAFAILHENLNVLLLLESIISKLNRLKSLSIIIEQKDFLN